MEETKKYKKQPPAVQKILLGMIGERIVASILRGNGHLVEESLNVFDTEKDMLVDGNPVEVKTQVPYVIEDSFAVFIGRITDEAILKQLRYLSTSYL